MSNKDLDLMYALFILASNGRLRRLFFDYKEYPEEFDGFYCPIKHAKEFMLQWEDRSLFDELCFWKGHLEDINTEEDEYNLTIHSVDSDNLGNIYDMMGETVLIVPLSFNDQLRININSGITGPCLPGILE